MKTALTNLLLLFSFFCQAQCLEGDCKNGYGVYEYNDNKFIYTGNFVDGSFSGNGKIASKEGDYIIEGAFKNGRISSGKRTTISETETMIYEGGFDNSYMEIGMGYAVFSNGDSVYGEWDTENSLTIDGTLFYTTGHIFKGIISADNFTPNGQGIYEKPNGEILVGTWKNGIMDGSGSHTYPNGSSYVGLYKDGNRHGAGVYTTSWGKTSKGTWTEGSLNGYIEEYDPETGNSYKGNVQNAKYHGEGTMEYGDGTMFEGTWKENSKSNGKLTFEHGSWYEGSFLNNDPVGEGKYYQNEKLVFEGVFAQFSNSYGKVWLSSKGILITVLNRDQGVVSMLYDNGDFYLGQPYIDGYYKTTYYHPNGEGMKVYANGKVIHGNWDNNIPVDTIQSREFTPSEAELQFQYGDVHRLYGYSYHSLAHFEKAVEIDPNQSKYYSYIAVQRFSVKMYNEALTNQLKAIELEPNNGHYYQELGNTYFTIEDYEKAQKNYSEAIKKGAESPEAFHFRGECYMKANNSKKALPDFTKAIELKPNPKSYTSRAKIYFDLGNKTKACEDITKAKELGQTYIESELTNYCN